MDATALSSVFANWPTNWIILGFIAVVIAAECLRAGTNRVVSLALALPLAFLILSALPSAAFLGGILEKAQTQMIQAIILLALVILAYILTYRILGFYSDSSGQPLQSLLTGVATTAILVVLWLQVPGLTSLWHFGDQVQAVFGEAYRFWWLLGSYITLAAVRS